MRRARRRAAARSQLSGDYFFITRGGVKNRSELDFPATEEGNADLDVARETGEIIKCIVLRCSKSKIVLAHVVPCKGFDEDDFVLNTVVTDLAWLGHTAMIIKGDDERALQAIIRMVIKRITAKCQTLEQVTKEETACYHSQSNGLMEVGVMLVRGLFRSLKLCLESSIEKRIPKDHALIPWLLDHTCLILNTAVKRLDGATSWRRIRGRDFH